VTALFRNAGAWHVFVDEDGVARLRTVEAGQRSGLDVLVTSGLEAGEQVVVNPPEALDDGMRIEALGGQ
jgi:HlyD family secretion protein